MKSVALLAKVTGARVINSLDSERLDADLHDDEVVEDVPVTTHQRLPASPAPCHLRQHSSGAEMLV